MVVLTTVTGRFQADVLAARLVDEGLDVELRTGLGGTYGFTVGDLAAVDVLVPADQIEDGRYILLVGEIDETLDEDPDERQRRIRAQVATPWRVAAVAMLFVACYPLVRLFF